MSSNQIFPSELGATRFFGIGGLGGNNLIEGWASPEENHTWNDGFETSLALFLARSRDSACVLTVAVWPHLGANLSRQDVTLYFNGYRLGFWRLDQLESYTLKAEIEPEFWFNRHGGTFGKCTWHLPNSTKPSELSRTKDHRLLGLCFQSITLAASPTSR